MVRQFACKSLGPRSQNRRLKTIMKFKKFQKRTAASTSRVRSILLEESVDARKAEMENLHPTLQASSGDAIDSSGLLNKVQRGLEDHRDVHRILIRLCPSAVIENLDQLTKAPKDTLKAKPKTAPQDRQRQDELNRSALRAFSALPDTNNNLLVAQFRQSIAENEQVNEMLNQFEKIILID